MKKSLINLLGIVGFISMLLLSCEEAPLDKTAAPDGELSKIKVVTTIEQTGDPNDDSGLPPGNSTPVNDEVKVSSEREGVVKRVWRFPGDANILTPNLTVVESSVGGQDVKLVDELGEVSISFVEPNDTNIEAERSGFIIGLTETLADGTIKRSSTQIQARDEVKAVINSFDQATVNAPISFKAGTLQELGLATNDVFGENQTVLEWDFGNGRLVNSEGEVLNVNAVTGVNNPDQSYSVVFPNITPEGGVLERVKLKLTRNYPVESIDSTFVDITVIGGLVPDRGVAKDAIKLSANGTEIRVGYSEEIADLSVINASDYTLSIDAAEINDSALRTKIEAITVSAIKIADDNPNDILLTLSSDIPSVLMDNVALSFTSESLKGVSGALISAFENSTVSQTGVNLIAALAADFEDSTTWNGGGFFFANPSDTPELSFSTERSLSGTTSFLFDTSDTDLSPSAMPNNFGIGASAITTAELELSSTTVEYEFSMWVYVEEADPETSLDMFLLDFKSDELNPSAIAVSLEKNKWIKLNAVREIDPASMPNGNPLNPRAIIRVVNTPNKTSGKVKIFVDQADVRLVDDGR